MQQKLKNQTWGIALNVTSVVHSTWQPNTHSFLTRSEPFDDYKEKRQNGEERDSPACGFPKDGRYEWETPEANWSRIKYIEGSGDRKWMEERDRNYLARLEKEALEAVKRLHHLPRFRLHLHAHPNRSL